MKKRVWIVAFCLVPSVLAAQQQGGLTLLDAVRTTITTQPAIKLAEERVVASRGDLQAANGQFDMSVSSSFLDVGTKTPNTSFEQEFQHFPPSSTANIATLNAGFSKLLKTGQLVNPTASIVRTDVSGVETPDNAATVSVFFLQPLLRGKDKLAVTAGVRSSEATVASSEADVRFLKSTGALQAAIGYWNYVAAVRRLAVFRESEDRARLIADQTRALIDAGTRPAADLKQVQANVASRVSQRIGGEQGVFSARQDLAVTLGIPYEQMLALPLPADDFPTPPTTGMPVLDALANFALGSRADLVSSRQKEASADAILVGAEDALKKKLDVQASLGYAGLSEGAAFWNYLTPMFNRPTGPNFTIGLNWTFSKENNAAVGRMVRSRSQLTQSRIQTGDLERTIQSNVAVAYDAVQHSIDKLAAAREAAASYRGAVTDQADLARLGVTTIIDLINTEDRLTNAQLDELVALQAYALALTQLRYQTGSLLNAQNDVDLTTLTTLPRD